MTAGQPAGRLARSQRKSPRTVWFWGFQMLVRLAGIEPTTPWFVAKYSIQLSYSRKGCYGGEGGIRTLGTGIPYA